MTKATACEVARQYNLRRPFDDSPAAYPFVADCGDYEVLVVDGETGAVLSRITVPLSELVLADIDRVLEPIATAA